MRRLIVFFAFAGLALAVIAPRALTSSAPDSRLKDAVRKAPVNGWTYVRLEGTPAEIGFQNGYLLAPEIQDLEGREP